MFTGLIEDVGRYLRFERGTGQAQIVIETRLPMDEIALGDSIAVNGVCLTVVRWGQGQFVADVSPESLDCTRLGRLKPGEPVNLERALRLGDRLGGHIVSGHVDGIGTIVDRQQDDNAIRFTLEIPAELARYVVEKGSIAIDGISLTVNEVSGHRFGLAIIPLSLAKTNLAKATVGTQVHIETDILGRYVEKLLGSGKTQSAGASLSFETLARNGFT